MRFVYQPDDEPMLLHPTRGGNIVRIFDVYAPPMFWGPWQEVFGQIGALGPNKDKNITKIKLRLSTISSAGSPFCYEIKGGDHLINGVASAGGAEETVRISGNVLTAISVRCMSVSQAQTVRIRVG